MPVEYAKAMRAWCEKNGALLIFDEVQAGFGRCGKWFGFEHYGVKADLIACGKGISSSLPISAVIGRGEVMDQYDPGTMTSTHSGSPICSAAALAAIKVIEKENLVANAAKVGDVLQAGLNGLMAKYPKVVGMAAGKGAGRLAADRQAGHDRAGRRPGVRHRQQLHRAGAAVLRPRRQGRRLGQDRPAAVHQRSGDA